MVNVLAKRNDMFGLFKSFNEKCASELLKIREIDKDHAKRWLSAFEQHISQQNEDGERKADFCIAWCATQHLHKIAKSDNPQDSFLASRCPVGVEDQIVNKVSVMICRVKKEQMHPEMKQGVESSLRLIEESAF